MMNNSNWKDYRHPKFLQSLSLTLNESKIMNLFFKRPNLRIDANQDYLKDSTLVSPRKSLNSTKIIIQEKVSIKI
jgi:hypothetical protein